MKNCILIVLLLCCNVCFGNAIDSIKTPQELAAFLEAIGEGKNQSLWDAQLFYKADFDQNGLTDICIDDQLVFVYMDMGNGKYDEHVLRGEKLRIKGITYKGAVPYLRMNVTRFRTDRTDEYYDTLVVYRNGAFVEHVDKPADYNINMISFEYTPGFCFDCHRYQLTIDAAGKANYESTVLNYEKKRQDTIRGQQQLTADVHQRIIDLLNYMNFEKLAKSYHLNVTCLSSSSLLIGYDDGKTKEIRDYGLQGTLALQQLYSIFGALYNDSGWTRTVTKGPTFEELFEDVR